jgi:D-ribose pyranase
MLKSGVINSEIIRILALMGASDQIIVSSCSFPRIEGVQVLDLSLVKGMPSVETVVDAISQSMDIDMVTLSDEVKESNPDFVEHLGVLEKAGAVLDYQSYRQLRIVAKNAVCVVRTGDEGLYKTSILRCR